MKYINIIILLIITTSLSAQTQTKRPSWSQGLPKRPSTSQPQKPGFEPERSTPTMESQPDIKTDRPLTPAIEIDLATQPELELNIQPENIQKSEIESVRRAGHRRLTQRSPDGSNENPLYQQYNWHLIKSKPINIPSRYATKNELKVRIYINPNGQVVRVAAGAPDVPTMMLKQAQQSIQQWQFEPPKNIGITDNIAKTFTIEIKTG